MEGTGEVFVPSIDRRSGSWETKAFQTTVVVGERFTLSLDKDLYAVVWLFGTPTNQTSKGSSKGPEHRLFSLQTHY